MQTTLEVRSIRVLVVDDNQAIHDDLRRILCPVIYASGDLNRIEEALFGSAPRILDQPNIRVSVASNGSEATEMVSQSVGQQDRFSVVFMDVRMGQGLDGIATTERLWEIDRDLQVVLCSAYLDYTWFELQQRLGRRDNLLFLKKPFENLEASQITYALAEKWRMTQAARFLLNN